MRVEVENLTGQRTSRLARWAPFCGVSFAVNVDVPMSFLLVTMSVLVFMSLVPFTMPGARFFLIDVAMGGGLWTLHRRSFQVIRATMAPDAYGARLAFSPFRREGKLAEKNADLTSTPYPKR